MKKSSLRLPVTVLAWAIALLLGVTYLLQAAWPKLSGDPAAIAQFDAFGYPGWFRILVGITEASAAILLFFPRTASLGAAILIAVMAGAVYTHLTTGHGSVLHASRNIALLAVLAISRLRVAWRPGKNRP